MKQCSECNKEFEPAPNHMYKRQVKGRTVFQCTYSCYRKAGGDDGRYGKSKGNESEAYLSEMREEIKK